MEKGGQISGGGGAGGGWDSIFEEDQSAKVLNIDAQLNLFNYATKITGAEWPDVLAIRSPCPTLNVVGAVTRGMVQREELKRMKELGRPGLTAAGEMVVGAVQLPGVGEASSVPPPVVAVPKVKKLSKRRRAFMFATDVVGFVASQTVGRVARLLGKRVLGEFPEEAKTGSFQPTQSEAKPSTVGVQTLANNEKLLEKQKEIATQLKEHVVNDKEDEKLFAQIYDGDTINGATPKVEKAPVEA